MKIIYAFVCFLFCFSTLTSYSRNPLVDYQLWNELEPYFLPEDHPIKAKLDKIFTESRASSSNQSLKDAHFHFKKGRTPISIIAAKHSKLKGYLVKLFTDDQNIHEEWVEWLNRIHGARTIQKAIARNKLERYFKVPQKWIYPLPLSEGHHRNHFVLVVEDMHILKESKNLYFWRSIAVDKQLLDMLFVLLQEEGLFDSIYPDNIPFCSDRKIAFIDTQHFNGWPIKFDRLTPYLRKEMQLYWEQRTSQ